MCVRFKDANSREVGTICPCMQLGVRVFVFYVHVHHTHTPVMVKKIHSQEASGTEDTWTEPLMVARDNREIIARNTAPSSWNRHRANDRWGSQWGCLCKTHNCWAPRTSGSDNSSWGPQGLYSCDPVRMLSEYLEGELGTMACIPRRGPLEKIGRCRV